MTGVLEQYSADLRADGMAPNTIVCYVGWPRRLTQGTGVPLTSITAGQIRGWIGGQSWSAATHRRAVTALQRHFRWQLARGLRRDDPAVGLRAARPGSQGGDPCPDDVLAAALRRASGDTYWRVRLAAETGLRRAELAQVHSGDVAVVGGVAWLRVAGKGGRVRRVPLSPAVASWVTGLHGWAFPSRDTPIGQTSDTPEAPPGSYVNHMHPDSVGRWYRRHLGRNVHSLRHRFAQAAYRTSHDVEAVRLALGHAQITTTQLYLHADADEVVAACRGAWLDDRLAAA